MLNLGVYHTLKIARSTQVGLFLTNGKEDVLLPLKYIPKEYEIGDELSVFVYLDHEERPVATTLKPYITLGDFAFLRVNYTNRFGAFLDWGLEKDLFVPFKEQARPMEEGKRYLVHLFLDTKTNRLVGSSKINQFLDKKPSELEKGEEVHLIISHITDIGINVIINGQFRGLVYKNEVYDDKIRPGDKRNGYVKLVRPDGKIDVTFHKIGLDNIEDSAQIILKELKLNKGFLRLTDDSHPEDIKSVLKMSKKTFKKAIGMLYRAKLILVKADGVYLTEN
ncbi:S1 RNA-binding domain-containing protein [Flavobacterium sp.]|uniref:CvfB family protein n=1 Tax=Flavobacterium sp. TaxID=239 RepID=UPI0035274277